MATFVQWTAVAFVVALVVIGLAPKSPVRVDLSVAELSGLDRIGGVDADVAVESSGRLMVRFADPSLALRMLHLGTTVPGLLLVAEIARRMARILDGARNRDPFTRATVRELNVLAKVTALGGLTAFAADSLARWGLSAAALESGTDMSLLQRSPLGWLGAALIIGAFGQVMARGVAMRTELDAVI